ncbi:MAG: diguanylate cyclase [Oscillospiraceae bacterium]|nr:diguanylate cyclase [Oscillospiraceae bacterium]
MRSIQSKFIILILIGIVLSASLIGAIAISRVEINANRESTALFNQLADTNAADINGLMGRIEQSVEVIAGCATDYVDSVERFSDDGFCDRYMDYLEPILLNAARSTDGSVAVYIRLNPEISTPVSGLFFTKTGADTELALEPNTDMSLYDPSDVEHVGWYYIPVSAGKPTWVGPYINKNINIYMISYVIPIYCGEELLGIVGMDIDFTMLQESVDSIKVMDTGYAYLADPDFNIVYHRMLDKGVSAADEKINFVSVYNKYATEDTYGNLYEYEHNGVKRRMSYRPLNNGIYLCVTAPQSEIDAPKNELSMQIVMITVIIAAVFVVVTILICRTLIRPLKKLTKAAKKIATGDLNVEIKAQTRDEIGTLASVFSNTVDKLREYIGEINRLAYIDALTGVENKTAYNNTVIRLEKSIRKGEAEFAVAVLDINGLKQTNDTHGHHYGDMLISNAATLISTTFHECPVYRVGGDEFVVVFEDEHYHDRESFCADFAAAMETEHKRDTNIPISIAFGISEYDPSHDESFNDVFSRADVAMYKNKKEIKASLKID